MIVFPSGNHGFFDVMIANLELLHHSTRYAYLRLYVAPPPSLSLHTWHFSFERILSTCTQSQSVPSNLFPCHILLLPYFPNYVLWKPSHESPN